jgi:hypothetical protein
VWTLLVEVAHVDAETCSSWRRPKNSSPVKALPVHAADPALPVSVRVRRLDGSPDHRDAIAAEDGVEGAAELPVTIVGQEPWPLLTVVEIISRLRACWVIHAVSGLRARDVFADSRADRDEEQHLQPPQPDGVDREEVGGEHRLGVLAEEVAPAGADALRRRRNDGAREDVPHQRRRNRDAEPAQLAGDPHVAPVVVCAGEPHDQLAHLLVNRRPARPRMRVYPPARDDLPVPAQERLGRSEERLLRASRDQAAERHQHQPVTGRHARPLPPQDRQLVAKYEDLGLL